jgi:hypothetical protein
MAYRHHHLTTSISLGGYNEGADSEYVAAAGKNIGFCCGF